MTLLVMAPLLQLLVVVQLQYLWDFGRGSICGRFDTCLTLWYYSLLLLPLLLKVLQRRRRSHQCLLTAAAGAAGATSWTEMEMEDCC